MFFFTLKKVYSQQEMVLSLIQVKSWLNKVIVVRIWKTTKRQCAEIKKVAGSASASKFDFHQLGPEGYVRPSVFLFVCAIVCSFFRPLIGPQVTWSVPGLLLALIANIGFFAPKPHPKGGIFYLIGSFV